MRDSLVIRRHAEELLERLRPLCRFHPETTEEQLTEIIELFFLRSQVNTQGNVHDEE
jgi:hypothetical protein